MKKSLWLFAVLLSQSLIAQNVGIGTSTPQSTLHVKGNQRIGGAASYMTFDTLSGKIVWTNSNLFVPVTQALMKHSAAADGLFYNNSGGTTGQLEYRNALGEPVFFTNFTNGRGYFKSRLGIATVSPLTGLHVADSSVLFSATGYPLVTPGPTPVQGQGRRMMWFADLAAFRVGFVQGNQWDKDSIGMTSFAAGYNTKAKGNHSTAFGLGSSASGLGATAMGSSTASGASSMSTGLDAVASGAISTAMGYYTAAQSGYETALGSCNTLYTPANANAWVATDRLFVIGNGSEYAARSDALVILKNGNIGIGHATPEFKLSFAPLLGDKISLWSNTSNSYGFGVQSGLLQIHTDVSYADIVFGYGSSSAMTERMRIVNAGTIGMELSGRIYLKNGTYPINPDDSPGIWLYNADNTGLLGFMGTQNNQNVGFYGGPGGWGFVYDALNSRVGIGTATPSFGLDVRGNGQFLGSFENLSPINSAVGLISSCATSPGDGIGMYGIGGAIGVYGGATGEGSDVRIGVSGYGYNGDLNYGTQGVSYSDDGTTAIAIYGVASGPGTNWAGYFNGAVYATSYSSSDRKLKEDIQSLHNAISIIQQLKPSSYTFKTNEYKQMQLPEGIHYGLIADEVQQVIPGIVKKAIQPAQYDKDDQLNGKKLSESVEFNTVNYTELIPVLIGAIQEQQMQLDKQQQLIEELKSLVDELRKK